ncbi:MAG: SIS domain-containing protein [Actinomycetota bacterium]|nr:SIS domain-containing protein [Actinomycetota bacterium]
MDGLLGELAAARELLVKERALLATGEGEALVDRLSEVSRLLRGVNETLCGAAGAAALVRDEGTSRRLDEHAEETEKELEALEEAVFDSLELREAGELERTNATLIEVKDQLWSIRRDRLRTANEVRRFVGTEAGQAAIDGYLSIQTALSALDRLEVRGRDSAGLSIFVWNDDLDLSDPDLGEIVARRESDPLFRSGALRVANGTLSFVYKAAAEIGELGDNVAALRRAIMADELLTRALQSETARASVLAHTRWASVGTISEANAHPLDELEAGDPEGCPHVVAVLNGDIDNYAELVVREELAVPHVITTDAKVIPMMVAQRMKVGETPEDAFVRSVAAFEGSMAIAVQTAEAPGRLFLAVRGSGQGLYVGLSDDAYIVASEPYGVIEVTRSYLRVDGDASAGRIVFLTADMAGSLEGIERRSYDGRSVPVETTDFQEAEITTRDIDRRGFPHFLLKEITESPESFRKTLRGRVADQDGKLSVNLDEQTVPADIARRLRIGALRRVIVVGQGTAAVAGQAVADAMAEFLAPLGVAVSALAATELSGFGLEDDMSDTLLVAISQSGTTTDTNRTVDLARARGASVLSVINRRNTDLGEKSHGVIYTSDGRDIEMSVASTKAFYAQIAAGFLLAVALAQASGCADEVRTAFLLSALGEMPSAMEKVLGERERISEIAGRHAPRRRHWAVVGSGRNRVAAAEVRIKLSELCYKSVACDATEDKKHIDLSAEPLIFVCAAGLSEPNSEDAAKEVSIYRAHKAAPVVVATEGPDYFGDDDVVTVPSVHPRLAFILSAMAGHLFGYEAALSIDAQARPLREIRSEVQRLAADGLSAGAILASLPSAIEAPATAFLHAVADGACDGVAKAGQVMQLATLLRCATGELPFETYELERGLGAGPAEFLNDLIAALTAVIDDLTRPIDAVKHQAKTVTVGISRSEDELFNVPLVKEVMKMGLRAEDLGYRALRRLAALNPAIAEVTGFTRYAVSGDVSSKDATIHVVDRGGVALELRSRTETDPALRGTKRAALERGEVEVTIGRSDGRPVILVPERKGDTASGLSLLHVRFKERLPANAAREVLLGYRPARYEALVAAVTETEQRFDDSLLGTLTMPDLLVEPVLALAERWRQRG